MATLVTRYVNPHSAGGNGTTNALSGANAAYASLAAWNTARARNLVTADEVEEVICETSGNADTSRLDMSSSDGWVVDATRYPHIKVAAGSRAGTAWDATKYRIDGAFAFVTALALNLAYVRVTGLQVRNTSTSAGSGNISSIPSTLTSFVVLDGVISKGALTYGFLTSGGVFALRNCVSIGNGTHGFQFNYGTFASQGNIDNCVAIANGSDGFFSGSSSNSVSLRNCYAGGNAGSDIFNDLGRWSAVTTCRTEDGTAGTTACAYHDVDALTMFWRCEGTTLDATDDYSAGDTTATLNAGATLTAGAAKSGSLGLDCDGNTTSDVAFSSASIVNRMTGCVGMWFRWTGGWFDGSDIFRYDGTNFYVSLWTQATSGRLGARYSITGQGQADALMAATSLVQNTWYFVVLRWDVATRDLIRLEVYNADGTLREGVQATQSGSMTGTAEGSTFLFGTAYMVANLDLFMASSRYDLPLHAYRNYTSYTSYLNSNVLFADNAPGSEDVELQANSALIDQGTDLSATFTTDILGVTRSGTWDIGAHEYAVPMLDIPFTAVHRHLHLLVR